MKASRFLYDCVRLEQFIFFRSSQVGSRDWQLKFILLEFAARTYQARGFWLFINFWPGRLTGYRRYVLRVHCNRFLSFVF